MSSIINFNEIEENLKRRWDPRGDVVVLYSNPPYYIKRNVHYININNSQVCILNCLAGLKISKVFYTKNGVDFEQIKIAPSNN